MHALSMEDSLRAKHTALCKGICLEFKASFSRKSSDTFYLQMCFVVADEAFFFFLSYRAVIEIVLFHNITEIAVLFKIRFLRGFLLWAPSNEDC